MIHNYLIYIYVIIPFICYYLFLGIILFLILHFGDNNQIDNNIEKDKGIVQLIKENEKGEIEIKKELLKSVNSFIACIGKSGEGKSTFGSNYYKILYNVKNDYFESSNSFTTCTKGIWMISEEERRKIPKYIEKDILDVEGFEIDKSKSWKYIMVIAFLSNDLIILNRNQKYEEVKKVIKIIQIGLKKMQEKNIPRILKRIYIQTTIINPGPIEELLKVFDFDRNIFKMINFKYIYLYNKQSKSREKQDLLKDSEYKNSFTKILDLLNAPNKYNSVTSLIDYIDNFNKVINGKIIFKSQNIYEDIETDFNGVYKSYEQKKKKELISKISSLKKLDDLNETFEEFIKMQIQFNFSFEINNEDFTFYGSCADYDEFYKELQKNKTFKVDPKELYFDYYMTERKRLEIQKNETEKQNIFNKYIQKKNEINKYFALLKFYENIDENMNLTIDIETQLEDYKLELENDLKNFFEQKKEEKKKEWADQIERAKWKVPVQAHGELKCKNGHNLKDIVHCGECHETLYWVDSDERYVICKGCNRVKKMGEHLVCKGCGADALATVKWISGYKP